ncbi:MAG TPA: carbamoyltransferase HypF [Symbiobacteriaceae bacterium]|nr:carbamoyltransferase HypF [Symbiobacteriaceae bacterium]
MERLATPTIERRRLQVRGIVQGVGFRPLVYRLAVANGLTGFVCNQRGEVLIEVEGAPAPLERFRAALEREARPPARIEQIEVARLAPTGAETFVIEASADGGGARAAFPPDLALCPACRADLLNPAGRFYQYPFTSCTYCGPRYAMIQGVPYDRPATTMAPFALCDACRAEYLDPCNRRFHAQSLACPSCGPQIELLGAPLAGDWRERIHPLLQAGSIAAVKGLGGFHLICDATNEAAVSELRRRKRRPRKPFALMARDIDAVEAHFKLSPLEREALTSARAPILLLRPRATLGERLPLESLAPGCHRIGLMLSYTPLHRLLFPDGMPFLVATSGNSSGWPIARTNEEALAQLGGIADLFLLHDRAIAVRVEDSVAHQAGDRIRLIRRSRGWAPEPIPVPVPPGDGPVVLAVGAEQKSTICLLQGREAVLGPHNGDLTGEEQLASWREGLAHLTGLLGVAPPVIAYDPHPGYLVSQEAARLFAGRRLEPVYHHHAHMAACMAEHGLDGSVIGCILDGTGYGPDGTLWGFEILAGDYRSFARLSHLKPIRLPGGETAIRQPWLVAVSLYHDLSGDAAQTLAWARGRFPAQAGALPLVLAQLDGRLPAPTASSAGRLFDGVAALLGLCTTATYEGEAAIRLGELAERHAGERADGYPIVCEGALHQTAPLIHHLLQDLERSVPVGLIALRFHRTVAEMVCQGAQLARDQTGLQRVVLGGGVWQNRLLLIQTEELLTQQGFQVYTPQQVPAGDGGIALGQAVIARWRWHQDVLGSSG